MFWLSSTKRVYVRLDLERSSLEDGNVNSKDERYQQWFFSPLYNSHQQGDKILFPSSIPLLVDGWRDR